MQKVRTLLLKVTSPFHPTAVKMLFWFLLSEVLPKISKKKWLAFKILRSYAKNTKHTILVKHWRHSSNCRKHAVLTQKTKHVTTCLHFRNHHADMHTYLASSLWLEKASVKTKPSKRAACVCMWLRKFGRAKAEDSKIFSWSGNLRSEVSPTCRWTKRKSNETKIQEIPHLF